MTSLKIDINDEYKIKIEKGNEFENSIFRDVYVKATKNVVEMIRQSESKYDTYNNLIAFTGERGKGKTSSMISFKNALINMRSHDHKSFFDSQSRLISEEKFVEIDTIDPSLFRGDEGLFEIIIAKIFSKFQEIVKAYPQDINHDAKRNVIKDFQNVFNNLKVLNGGKRTLYDKEPIEALSEMAYGTNLYKSFGDLIKTYLEQICKADYLVIAIDDFDLNISGAYKMLEDIRQFLIQKRVIILIACKMEQLGESIVNELVNEYKAVYEYSKEHKYNLNNIDLRNSKLTSFEIGFREPEFIVDEYVLKANKYLEKLFPFSHVLSMPVIRDFSSINYEEIEPDSIREKVANISINIDKDSNQIFTNDRDNNRASNFVVNELINDGKLFVGSDLQDLILELIFKKTGVFISKPKYRLNSVIPGTLREIHNLIGALVISEQYVENFRSYIVDLSKNELPPRLSNIFVNLEKQDVNTLDIYLLNSIGEIKAYFNVATKNEFNYLLHPRNPANTSMGDVFFAFRKFYENVKSSNEIAIKFLDYLSVYYAIRIKITEDNDPKILNNLLKGGYFNNYSEIFPKRLNKDRRDWIIFKRGVIDDLSQDLRYWIGFFIPFLGNLFADYRNRKESPFFKDLNTQGGQIMYGIFSPLTPLSHILYPDEIWNSIMRSDSMERTPLYYEVKKWNESNKLQSFLNNNMFYNEFLELWDEFSKKQHKSEGLGDYESIIRDYIFQSSRDAMQMISLKYPFLNLDKVAKIEDNPIYKFWKSEDNERAISSLINSIFNESNDSSLFNENDISIAKKLLKQYRNYLFEPMEGTSRGAKYAMNSVVKAFEEDSVIKERLQSYRDRMNQDLQDGLMQIRAYLEQIVNG